jgi:hypothetical protein
LQNSHKLVIISDKFTVFFWILFFIFFSTPVFSFFLFFFFSSISLSSYDTASAATMISPEILVRQSRIERDNEENTRSNARCRTLGVRTLRMVRRRDKEQEV